MQLCLFAFHLAWNEFDELDELDEHGVIFHEIKRFINKYYIRFFE